MLCKRLKAIGVDSEPIMEWNGIFVKFFFSLTLYPHTKLSTDPPFTAALGRKNENNYFCQGGITIIFTNRF